MIGPEDMWTPVLDRRTGLTLHLNILTFEKVADVLKYDGEGVRKRKELHIFQPEGSKSYRKRKIWLSICQIQEWITELDPYNGFQVYRYCF